MENSKKKYKIGIIISHVIQYAVPLYRKLSSHPEIELTVFFCSPKGLSSKYKDKEFGLNLQWDSVVLEGFKYKFLKNYSPLPNIDSIFGLINLDIFKELKSERYDAIVIPGYAKISYWLAFFAALLTKTPIIVTGEPPTPWRPKIKKTIFGIIKKILLPFMLKKTKGIFYIGLKSKEFYLDYYKKSINKMFFYPFCVDNDYYFSKYEEYKEKKNELKKELGLPLNYPVILYLSKLISWKRPDFLLRAYREIADKAILVFVGSGKKLPLLKKYARLHNLKNVYFFGFQNYSQVPKFYSIADIFVLPSLGESWGLVINEAMCFGLPVITTDQVMSYYDLVKNGVTGFVIEKNDSSSLSYYLDYLLAHPEVRLRMGRAAQDLIREWNYEINLKAYLDFFKKS